ncbi:hypothetical protein SPFL3102_03562 [Sporomusaceae bacterium FL31]|nr:hypothetical protein SPFL3101_00443 [Sporomusaceae bacterium FL31]GCE35711.1 hypothetical protein SPFL3102_03562 [Sporomusaceae bacterium]
MTKLLFDSNGVYIARVPEVEKSEIVGKSASMLIADDPEAPKEDLKDE